MGQFRSKFERVEASEVIDLADRYRWAVAMVWAGREAKARQDLRNAGFFPYSPLGKRFTERTIGRTSGLTRRVRCTVAFSVFGSYLFVGQRARLLGRSVSAHIVDVLGDESGPMTLSSEAVRAIAAAEFAGVWDQVSAKSRLSTEFRAGQAIRIKEGPFAGFAAIVRGLEGNLRYTIETSLFGRQTRVTLEACQIEAQ